MAALTLMLQARERFGGQRVPAVLAPWLGRSDASDMSTPPSARLFDILPRGWPVAAVTRQLDARDAAGAQWLRADPAFIQPDLSGARLMAHGPALGLSADDCSALMRELKPLFGDSGLLLDAPVPHRWYLRLADGTPLPGFIPPEHALGADLFEHIESGPEARRWRALLSEAQVLLHNHPLNRQRAAQGRAPVNSLWFWGAGRVPDRVACTYKALLSDDETLCAFAVFAGTDARTLPDRLPDDLFDRDTCIDLREQRDAHLLGERWLQPALSAIETRELDALVLAFDDGRERRLARSQRWRFWRRPITTFAAA